MFIENRLLAAHVSSLAATACMELFQAYGVHLTPSGSGWEPSEEPVLSAVMGFQGSRLRGTCLLVGAPGPLAASCPIGGQTRDWIGELTSQLVGRLKAKLLSHNVDVALTTPIVLSGARLQPMPSGPFSPTVFSATSGFVLLWIEAEGAGDLDLGSEQPRQLISTEGDILLF